MEEEVLYEGFFKDEPSEYIFYLTQTHGANRCKLLNLTEDLYNDKAKAIEWHNNIYNAILKYEDKEAISKAVKELESMFAMIMKAYEEE